MDQVKNILKLAVKYRFWIVVGVAALLPMIGYFASAGSINEQEQTKAAAVQSAYKDVQQYQSGVQPIPKYVDLTEQRTGVLNKEIRQAWQMLYEQQAPLLTWPPEVAEQYTSWGPRWPEGVSSTAITLTNNTYAAVYPQYVDKVYDSFRPFNYEDGSGIVVAPVKDSLLRPVEFTPAQPPTLGKVWAAQQKLWIQGTVLDVVDKVNGHAESWDEAPIKQITGLEVANPKSQDQQSIAKGVSLVLAPEIVRPGTETAASSAPAASEGMEAEMMEYASQGGGMGGGAQDTAPEEVYIFEQSAGQQFREIPVYIAVLVEQSRMLDLIEAFRRSPMSIQVVDFEMQRPSIKVEKPEKGQKNPGFSSLMGYGEMFLGGNSSMMDMMGRGMMGGGMMGGTDASMMDMMGRGMMGGGYGMTRRAPLAPRGTDIAKQQYEKLQKKAEGKNEEKEEEKEEQAARPKGNSFADPYYNIVEVHVYGRSRFYDPPPAEEVTEPESIGAEPVAADGEPAADGTMPAEALDPASGDATAPIEPAASSDAILEPVTPNEEPTPAGEVTPAPEPSTPPTDEAADAAEPGATAEAAPAPEPTAASNP